MSTTRRPLRRVAVLVPVLLCASGLTACGVADDQPRPGLAASVEGDDISLSRVDEATTQYCVLYGEDQSGQTQAVPRSFQRRQVAGTFILQSALERIVDERGLDPSSDYESSLADIRSQFADRPDSDGLIDFFEANAYVGAAVDAVSADEGAATADPTATPPGLDVAFDWLRDHDVEINPVIGLEVSDEGLRTSEGEDLSVAVSDEARLSDLDVSDADVDAQIADLVETLPADQVCGA